MFSLTKKVFAVMLFAILAMAISSCTTYRPAPRSFQEASAQPYVLDSGDRLRINVFDQPNLTNTYTIDQAGYISFPLIGQVAARGQTIQKLEGAIAARLKQGYLRQPDVSIEIDRYRPVFIMGEVNQAGQYSYVPGMTVQNAVAIAGGFSSRADQTGADVSRRVNGSMLSGHVPITDPVLAGDTIYIRERLF